MQHGIRFKLADNALYLLLVANIGVLKAHLRLPAHPIEILVRALSRQIIEQDNRPAARMEMLRSVHADKTSASSDQNRLDGILLLGLKRKPNHRAQIDL